MNKPMSNDLREKIKIHIKNGADISDLIKDVDIKGEDLSRAVIKRFDRPDDDISKCNFCQAIIGEEGHITNLSRIDGKYCNFHRAKFLGTIWLRNADMRHCNFREAYMVSVDYKFSDFRGCDLCNVKFCIGSDIGVGAKFDEKFFKDLSENWGLEIRLKK